MQIDENEMLIWKQFISYDFKPNDYFLFLNEGVGEASVRLASMVEFLADFEDSLKYYQKEKNIDKKLIDLIKVIDEEIYKSLDARVDLVSDEINFFEQFVFEGKMHLFYNFVENIADGVNNYDGTKGTVDPIYIFNKFSDSSFKGLVPVLKCITDDKLAGTDFKEPEDVKMLFCEVARKISGLELYNNLGIDEPVTLTLEKFVRLAYEKDFDKQNFVLELYNRSYHGFAEPKVGSAVAVASLDFSKQFIDALEKYKVVKKIDGRLIDLAKVIINKLGKGIIERSMFKKNFEDNLSPFKLFHLFIKNIASGVVSYKQVHYYDDSIYYDFSDDDFKNLVSWVKNIENNDLKDTKTGFKNPEELKEFFCKTAEEECDIELYEDLGIKKTKNSEKGDNENSENGDNEKDDIKTNKISPLKSKNSHDQSLSKDKHKENEIN